MTLGVPAPDLTDGFVTLRPLDERDLAAIDLGIHDPEVIRWFGQPTASARDVLEQNRTRWIDRSGPTLAICETVGNCIGLVWVNLSHREVGTGDIGYWLLPRARGCGLATRAVRLISPWAVHVLGINRLRLLIEPENERSQRVAERTGFMREGVLPGHGEIDGRSIDHVVFSLAPEV